MCTLPGWGNMGKYQKIVYFSEKKTIEKRSTRKSQSTIRSDGF